MASLRKKKTLAKPFVLTVAQITAAVLTPGCITNPPEVGGGTCPPSMPIAGDVCATGTNCSYGMDACGIPLSASCPDGVWQVQGPVICNPPPPDPMCPTDLPAAGAPCNWDWQTGFGCTYPIDNGCGLQMISVTCNGTTTTVEYSAPSCGQCATLTTEGACSTDSACRWLTPGCSMSPLPMAGCFPAADCVTDTDCTTAGQTCQEFSYNPCYNKNCDACGASAKVCASPAVP